MEALNDVFFWNIDRDGLFGNRWDGKSDIKLPTQEWIVFRLNTTIE